MTEHDQRVIHRHSGYVLIDHLLEVPLDHAAPAGERIALFAREIVAESRENDGLPWLLYLQGGPGHRAPRGLPVWVEAAAQDYRVVLLDQRGTGRSTPLTRQTLAGRPDAAARLRLFRADSIVKDAELLRARLTGGRPWSVLGQSFGGFCATTYLSFAPEGLSEVFITGGLPSLTATADDVYRAAYPRVLAHNEGFFARYPGDEEIALRVADILRTDDVRLPSGERLTVRRFQTAGLGFGTKAEFDDLHYLLEEAFAAPSLLSEVFLRRLEAKLSFAEHPLYALLHEAIYAQGTATDWAADRVRADFPEFDGSAPFRFTGEMIYPWLFAEDASLAPLRDAAHSLAAFTDWPALYDPAALARNTVPVAAAIYADDMYVDRDMSLTTASAIKGLTPWVTPDHAHDGLRESPKVLTHLKSLLHP
ncbi:alpha/beta hydrolase family protein [Actinocorallia herbida]|uniref:Alpha/beta hydrolase family protein n=1 Tax=Actinocorallia herbida TaxID=58109 RepID=A0A3N1DBZ9_9ACTN|nr:alpha/beta fold hydrolase [Actinocorallia herbida]ROO91054.1 alpha/beta hydrolase family protein [Actinocorallia herbida]